MSADLVALVVSLAMVATFTALNMLAKSSRGLKLATLTGLLVFLGIATTLALRLIWAGVA